MLTNFKILIESNFIKPLDKQKDMLNEAHLKWKGNKDQIDDIIVVGIKF